MEIDVSELELLAKEKEPVHLCEGALEQSESDERHVGRVVKTPESYSHQKDFPYCLVIMDSGYIGDECHFIPITHQNACLRFLHRGPTVIEVGKMLDIQTLTPSDRNYEALSVLSRIR